MAGRKNKPKNAKIITGTFRQDREKKNPVAPDKDLPRAPSTLSKRGCEIFGMLTTRIDLQKYASASHTEMLYLLAMRLDEIEICNELIETDGLSYTITNRQGEESRKIIPEVKIRQDAARHAQSLLAEFGLSPAAMQKINIPEGKTKKDEWSDFGT